jgi:hypothetical protein
LTAVARLVTYVEVDDDGTDPRSMSASARLEAELEDGRRVVLLDDRGWNEWLSYYWEEGSADPKPSAEELGSVWDRVSVEDIEDTARTVVGPDEPAEGHSQQEAEASHWAFLSDVLHKQGVDVDAPALARLPHDVVLGERMLARLRRSTA